MRSNSNLLKSKLEINDEFYTKVSDIEDELRHYKDHFKGKIIYLNCDNPSFSNFYKYLNDNFIVFGLKKIITSHYGDSVYGSETTLKNSEVIVRQTLLKGNGDFRSDELINAMRKADIIIGNPPFSLFREYVAQIMKYDKKFLIIGPVMQMGTKEIFSLIKGNKIWLGHKRVTHFITSFGENKAIPAQWFTNLDHPKKHKKIVLHKKFVKSDYEKYDNYDAINVDRVKDIPMDYYGEMGVPITFLSQYNPNQFEIIWFRYGNDKRDLRVNGKDKVFRVVIKRRGL